MIIHKDISTSLIKYNDLFIYNKPSGKYKNEIYSKRWIFGVGNFWEKFSSNSKVVLVFRNFISLISYNKKYRNFWFKYN
jgi:hypothetical protein